MRVLICNDDGVAAPGIAALARRLAREHEVTVVAPAVEQSGMGHRTTYLAPIFVKEAKIEGLDAPVYALSGSPVDCAYFGIDVILKRQLDLVVSGVNQGSNEGSNVFPSGTANAAFAGAFAGYQALAVSLCSFEHGDFDVAAEYAARAVNYIKDHPLGNYRMLNVNVPPLPMEKIKGVKFVPMETDRYRVYYDERRRGGFNDHLYYWLCEDKPECAPTDDPAHDRAATKNGYVSVTPFDLDLTDRAQLQLMQQEASRYF